MARWYKHAERKRISNKKYERIEAAAIRLGKPFIEVTDMPPAVNLRFKVAIRIFGYHIGDYFYWRHPITTVCYRFSCHVNDNDKVQINGCWNETVNSRDWELIEADSIAHGELAFTNHKLLPSYRLPENSHQNNAYRKFLREYFLYTKYTDPKRFEIIYDKIKHIME